MVSIEVYKGKPDSPLDGFFYIPDYNGKKLLFKDGINPERIGNSSEIMRISDMFKQFTRDYEICPVSNFTIEKILSAEEAVSRAIGDNSRTIKEFFEATNYEPL